MNEYLVIYEQAADGAWGAYLPDLPGVAAGGESREEVEQLIREAASAYVAFEREHGAALPSPAHQAGIVAV